LIRPKPSAPSGSARRRSAGRALPWSLPSTPLMSVLVSAFPGLPVNRQGRIGSLSRPVATHQRQRAPTQHAPPQARCPPRPIRHLARSKPGSPRNAAPSGKGSRADHAHRPSPAAGRRTGSRTTTTATGTFWRTTRPRAALEPRLVALPAYQGDRKAERIAHARRGDATRLLKEQDRMQPTENRPYTDRKKTNKVLGRRRFIFRQGTPTDDPFLDYQPAGTGTKIPRISGEQGFHTGWLGRISSLRQQPSESPASPPM